MKRPGAAGVDVIARVGESGLRIPTGLVYERCDPYAVKVRFDLGGKVVEWVFARSLLEDGLRRPAGLGDVRVAPVLYDGDECVELRLASDTGDARIELPRKEVRAFLDESGKLVPAGAERARIDWDLELALLTEGGPNLAP